MFKKIFFIIFIIIVSGISGIIADHFLFPYIAANDFFSRYSFLKKSMENTTVINRTEQVYIKEDSTVAKLMSPVVSSVVNIITYPNPDLKSSSSKNIFQPQNQTSPVKNGTGLIATSDGVIMTYSGAIIAGDQASQTQPYKYKIILSNGNIYDADLVGVDSWSNLAFLKINASNLSVVSLGNFSDYQAGEKVIAIGNDYSEYQNRFSSGILNSFNPTYNISGKALNVPEKLEGVFETDFNGNSMSVGGPLVDYSGKIIGIVGSALVNGNMEYFTIPSDKAEAVLNKVIQKDLNSNPTLGFYYLPISQTAAIANNLTAASGALVYSPSGQNGLAVIADSPAAIAGIKIGDVITKVNNEEITLNNNLSTILYKYKKGDDIKLTLERGGQEMNLSVKL